MSEEKALRVREPSVSFPTKKQIEEYLFTSNTKLTEEQMNTFYHICLSAKLNPILGEAHAIAFWNPESRKHDFKVVTSYLVYVQRAEQLNNLLDGYNVDTHRGVSPHTGREEMFSTLTVHRKDWSKPFEYRVWLSEYMKYTKEGHPTRFWKKPIMMLEKCAIGGFRRCFPTAFKGMPYMIEELPDFMKEAMPLQPKKGDLPPLADKPPAEKEEPKKQKRATKTEKEKDPIKNLAKKVSKKIPYTQLNIPDNYSIDQHNKICELIESHYTATPDKKNIVALLETGNITKQMAGQIIDYLLDRAEILKKVEELIVENGFADKGDAKKTIYTFRMLGIEKDDEQGREDFDRLLKDGEITQEIVDMAIDNYDNAILEKKRKKEKE